MAKPLSVHLMAYTYYECYPLERFGMESVESTAIRWALGCVNSRLAATGSQDAGFTQPRVHLIALLCMQGTYTTEVNFMHVPISIFPAPGHTEMRFNRGLVKFLPALA